MTSLTSSVMLWDKGLTFLIKKILNHYAYFIDDGEQMGFPGAASGKEPNCQCRKHRRYGFDPWVGKIPGGGRKWQPIPVFLSEESHGQRSLEGYGPWGCKELDITEAT